MRKRPCPSMRVAPEGTGVEAEGPSASMRSPRTTTVCPSSTRSLSSGSTATPTKATVGSCEASGGGAFSGAARHPRRQANR